MTAPIKSIARQIDEMIEADIDWLIENEDDEAVQTEFWDGDFAD